MQHLKFVETRKISEILTVKDDCCEGVLNIKYLWNVINSTDGETEAVSASILSNNKVYCSLYTTFLST
jgi:hypothetical protein